MSNQVIQEIKIKVCTKELDEALEKAKELKEVIESINGANKIKAEESDTIKLTKVDFDILDCMLDRILRTGDPFNESYILLELKNRGYFQGVIFESMSVEEILEKCEVIENV